MSRPERRRPAPAEHAFQYNLFSGEAESIRIDVDAESLRPEGERSAVDEGIEVVSSAEGSHVIVTGFGCWLGKRSERLAVRRGDGKVLYQFPFRRLQKSSSAAAVSVSRAI